MIYITIKGQVVFTDYATIYIIVFLLMLLLNILSFLALSGEVITTVPYDAVSFL